VFMSFWCVFSGKLSSDTGYGLIFIARLALSIAWGAIFPTVMAHIAETSAPSQRAAGFALLGSAFGLGSILGPMLAWLVSDFGLLAPFAFAAVAALCALALLALRMPTDPSALSFSTSSTVTTSAFSVARDVAPFLCISLITVLVSGLLQQLMAIHLQDGMSLTAGQAVQRAGLVLTLMSVVTVLVQSYMSSGRSRVSHWGASALLRLGSALTGLAFVILAATSWTTLSPIALAAALFGAGLGMLFPGVAVVISQAVAPQHQGRVHGLNSSAQGLGLTIGPLVGTALYGASPSAPYVFGLVAIAASICLSFAPVLRSLTANRQTV
jgi:MFS family permease